ncbi:MAG: hypothetical protein ACOH2Q_20580 [Rhodococcus sp. (in: high G+C Gram-positive bacteria)]
MSADSAWRRELHRIRDEHRIAMGRAADMIGRTQTPTTARDRRTSDTASPNTPETGPVLQPAHLDRREPTPHVETEPEEQPRSWLV